MNVLIVIDDLLPGGRENDLLSIAGSMSEETKMTIISLFGTGPLISAFEEAGVHVRCLELKRRQFLKAFIRIRRLCVEERFGVAVCERDFGRSLFPWLLKRYIPKVFMTWGNPIVKRDFPRCWLERAQLRFADGFIVPSETIVRALRERYDLNDVSVIPNCVRLDRFSLPSKGVSSSSSPLKIISVGNLRDEKNQMEQIKIMEKVVEGGLDVDLTIVGEGPNRQTIEKAIRKSGLERNVKLTGRRIDVPALLGESDLFLFTSKSEGFGVAIIEAMAAGLPCVLYDLPVLREIDPGKKCLRVVAQGDAATATAEIADLASDPETRCRLGAAGREIVANRFSSETCAALWEKTLREG